VKHRVFSSIAAVGVLSRTPAKCVTDQGVLLEQGHALNALAQDTPMSHAFFNTREGEHR